MGENRKGAVFVCHRCGGVLERTVTEGGSYPDGRCATVLLRPCGYCLLGGEPQKNPRQDDEYQRLFRLAEDMADPESGYADECDKEEE